MNPLPEALTKFKINKKTINYSQLDLKTLCYQENELLTGPSTRGACLLKTLLLDNETGTNKSARRHSQSKTSPISTVHDPNIIFKLLCNNFGIQFSSELAKNKTFNTQKVSLDILNKTTLK